MHPLPSRHTVALGLTRPADDPGAPTVWGLANRKQALVKEEPQRRGMEIVPGATELGAAPSALVLLANAVAGAAAGVAASFGQEVVRRNPAGGAHPRPLLDAAHENCEAFRRYFVSRDLPADARVLFGATPWSILRAADTVPATLIALASHRRPGFKRVSLGGTAAAIVQKARCPVFVASPAATNSMAEPRL